MKVADAIANWCQQIKAPFVAGIPGSGILEIMDALSRNTEVPFILTRHEQGAAMMAYSYGYQTRRPAIAVASKAPGATNLAIGVMGAFVESLPLIAITAQVSSMHVGYEAFEEMDLVEFFRPITKWSTSVIDPSRVIEILNEAFRRSVSGRPGPVHIAIPYNFMNKEVDRISPPLSIVPAGVSNAEIVALIEMIAAARRPLIIAGGGVPFGMADDVLEIARFFDAPIVSSWMRKPVPDRDPYFLGMAGIGGSPAAQTAIRDADLVLALGCRFSEQMTEHYRMKFAQDARIIQIDIDPGVIARVFPVAVGLQSDLTQFLPAFRGELKNVDLDLDQGRVQWRKELQGRQAQYLSSLEVYGGNPVQPQGRNVVKELRSLLPSDSVLVLDSGNYLHWAEQYFPVEQAGLFHYPTSGTMGFGIPGAIGAKFAHPERLVCALVGDGGFAMTMSELETSTREGVPILVVIINNGTLGHIRIRQDVNFSGRRVGVDFSHQHFKHVAQAFQNVYSAEVDNPTDLRPVLEEAINVVLGGSTAVVDVHVSDELSDAPVVDWWKS